MHTEHGYGETRLTALVAGMRPRRMPGEFAFALLPEGQALPESVLGTFREDEGLTVILPSQDAEARGLEVVLRAVWIVLDVHSSLEAIGFTAAFSRALAEAGIACNVIAALKHDHLFVPVEQADRAMEVLQGLQTAAMEAANAGVPGGG